MVLKFILIVLLSSSNIHGSRVLELSDRFLELKNEYSGPWLIKFYAPWCHHCKNLEPIWSQVAQSMYDMNIHIARVDCTRFTSVATHYSVSGFPTILFIDGDDVVTYQGDRTTDEIVDFAQRMIGPAVRDISNSDEMESVMKKHKVLFLLISSEIESDVDVVYRAVAKNRRNLNYFYRIRNSLTEEKFGVLSESVILVLKDSTYQTFVYDDQSVSMNVSLDNWIKKERFPFFLKITNGNLHEVLKSEKFILTAIVKEDPAGKLIHEFNAYVQKIKDLSVQNRKEYGSNFLFGWIADLDLASSIAMTYLSVPNLLVLNSTTHHYHLATDVDIIPEKISPDKFKKFLDDILNESVPFHGGTGFATKIYRVFYDMTSTLHMMWKGSPVLTLLLFGVPLGFLSLICYTTFCSDIMDSSDEDDEDEDYMHEKKE